MKHNQKILFLFAEVLLNFIRSATFIFVSVKAIIHTDYFYLLSILGAIESLFLFLGPIVSIYVVEKFGSKLTLNIFIIISILCPLMLILLYLYDVNPIYLCFSLSILLSIISPQIKNAIFCLIPYLNDKKNSTKSNASFNMVLQLGYILGVLLAPIMVNYISYVNFIALFMLIHIIILAIIILALDGINVKKLAIKSGRNKLVSFLNSIKTLPIIELIISSIDITIIIMFNTAIVIIVNDLFLGKAIWLSSLEILFAISSLSISLLISNAKIGLNRYIYIFSTIFFILMLLFALLDNYILVILCCMFFGIFQASSNILWKSYIHNKINEEFWSRANIIKGGISTITAMPVMYFIAKMPDTKSMLLLILATALLFFTIGILYIGYNKYRAIKQ